MVVEAPELVQLELTLNLHLFFQAILLYQLVVKVLESWPNQWVLLPVVLMALLGFCQFPTCLFE